MEKNEKKEIPDYDVIDFINDDSFVHAVRHPDSGEAKEWREIPKAYPAIQQRFAQASQLVRLLRFRSYRLGDDQSRQIWQHVSSATAAGRRRRLWVAVASSAILLLGCIFLYRYLFPLATVEIRTQYGELKSISLPDGSSVLLNGNSSLTYKRNWNKNELREVWFEGDGKFDIVHTEVPQQGEEASKFLVNAENTIIEVLGTEFILHSRRGVTKAMLKRGKIALSIPEDGQAKRHVVYPGETIAYNDKDKSISKWRMANTSLLDWSNQHILFRNATLQDVFDYFQDVYGYQMMLEEKELKNKRVYMELSLKDKEKMMEAIAAVFGLEVSHSPDKKTWTFSSRY